MNPRAAKGWLKHGDFIVLDLVCLHLCTILAFFIRQGFHNPYNSDSYLIEVMVLLAAQLGITVFSGSYKNIIRRKRFDEMISVIRYIVLVAGTALIALFMVKESSTISRIQFGVSVPLFIPFSFILRQLNKLRIYRSAASGKRRSIVVVTSAALVREAIDRLTAEDVFQDYKITGVAVMDSTEGLPDRFDGVQIKPLNDSTIRLISRGWVDEVFILQPDNLTFPTKFLDELMEMGITVNYSMSVLDDERWPVTDIRKLGPYKVLTNSFSFASAGQLLLKRVLDILGGIVGCILTGIIFLFIAPAIYVKSPGPIFFKQERVGRNGKTFQMYKFRSMYLDAEERKAELMAQNDNEDGMMFKMADDPRIIGSEKKDKNGKPKGIGNFIRNTSLDEFPQFFNVLKGEMSLVGTRPPTLDEWRKYDLEHRIRMSIKPGITGMWQVSGRSEIKNFDEVVRLDRDYIQNWSLLMDLKILLKTVEVVLLRKGAE